MLPIYSGSIFFTNKKYIFAALPERCLSGRKSKPGKFVYWQRYRGFESLSLREILKALIFSAFFIVIVKGNLTLLSCPVIVKKHLNTQILFWSVSSGSHVFDWEQWPGAIWALVAYLLQRHLPTIYMFLPVQFYPYHHCRLI